MQLVVGGLGDDWRADQQSTYVNFFFKRMRSERLSSGGGLGFLLSIAGSLACFMRSERFSGGGGLGFLLSVAVAGSLACAGCAPVWSS